MYKIVFKIRHKKPPFILMYAGGFYNIIKLSIKLLFFFFFVQRIQICLKIFVAGHSILHENKKLGSLFQNEFCLFGLLTHHLYWYKVLRIKINDEFLKVIYL